MNKVGGVEGYPLQRSASIGATQIGTESAKAAAKSGSSLLPGVRVTLKMQKQAAPLDSVEKPFASRKSNDHLAKGRLLGFVLTPGQTHDRQGFGSLFRMLAARIEALLADKGYNADAIRAEIEEAGVEAVIPASSETALGKIGDAG